MKALLRRTALSLVLCCLTLLPALADDATITLGTRPEPPDCSSPGEIVTIFWNILHETTPEFVYYALYDSNMQLVQEETYPGSTGIDIVRDFTIPPDPPLGSWLVHVEYWSEEVGLEARAEVIFLVCCDQSPADESTWGSIKELFRP